MNLHRLRIALGKRTAASGGVGYTSIRRVKHIRHLVFDVDLPEWDAFQEARFSEGFRGRKRFDLRTLARFSRTLRRWGFLRQ